LHYKKRSVGKLESIHVGQGGLGHLLDYGNFAVSGTGGTIDSFFGIAEPFESRKKIQEQIQILKFAV